MDFENKRRWPRYDCEPVVTARVYWAHRLMPYVSVKVFDVSKRGFGFSSERKLQEGSCEIRIRSFPNLIGEIKYRKEVVSDSGERQFQYGFFLSSNLHKIQLENLGCNGIQTLEYRDREQCEILG